jgi:hypothetical protein
MEPETQLVVGVIVGYAGSRAGPRAYAALMLRRNQASVGEIPEMGSRFGTEGSKVQILSPRPITSAGRPEKSGLLAVRMVWLSLDGHSVPPERSHRFKSFIEADCRGNIPVWTFKGTALVQFVMLTLCSSETIAKLYMGGGETALLCAVSPH